MKPKKNTSKKNSKIKEISVVFEEIKTKKKSDANASRMIKNDAFRFGAS